MQSISQKTLEDLKSKMVNPVEDFMLKANKLEAESKEKPNMFGTILQGVGRGMKDPNAKNWMEGLGLSLGHTADVMTEQEKKRKEKAEKAMELRNLAFTTLQNLETYEASKKEKEFDQSYKRHHMGIQDKKIKLEEREVDLKGREVDLKSGNYGKEKRMQDALINKEYANIIAQGKQVKKAINSSDAFLKGAQNSWTSVLNPLKDNFESSVFFALNNILPKEVQLTGKANEKTAKLLINQLSEYNNIIDEVETNYKKYKEMYPYLTDSELKEISIRKFKEQGGKIAPSESQVKNYESN